MFRTFLTYENVQFDSEVSLMKVYKNFNYITVLKNIFKAVSGTLIRDQNNEWKLSSVVGSLDVNNPMSIKFTFKLKRFSDMFYNHVYVPGYFLMTLTLLILLTTNESFWRLILSGLNIYLHFSLMDRVWWQ